MKNPFENNNQKSLIGIVLGAAAIGTAVYIFRKELSQLLGNVLKKEPEAEIESRPEPQAYLRHKHKAQKTDRDALLHNRILHEPGIHEA